MSISRTFRLTAVAAVLALAAACSDDPTGPKAPAAGKYRLALAGDYAARHTGDAVFGVDGAEGAEYFAVLLGDDVADMANLVILRSGATRLEVGTHQIANTSDQVADPANSVEVLLGVGNDTSSTVGFFDGQGGTVTITKSTADVVAGTFALTVKGLLEQDGDPAEPATLQVSGAFTAEAVAGVQGARMQVRGLRVERLSR
jgi:hypothetical protein